MVLEETVKMKVPVQQGYLKCLVDRKMVVPPPFYRESRTISRWEKRFVVIQDDWISMFASRKLYNKDVCFVGFFLNRLFVN